MELDIKEIKKHITGAKKYVKAFNLDRFPDAFDRLNEDKTNLEHFLKTNSSLSKKEKKSIETVLVNIEKALKYIEKHTYPVNSRSFQCSVRDKKTCKDSVCTWSTTNNTCNFRGQKHLSASPCNAFTLKESCMSPAMDGVCGWTEEQKKCELSEMGYNRYISSRLPDEILDQWDAAAAIEEAKESPALRKKRRPKIWTSDTIDSFKTKCEIDEKRCWDDHTVRCVDYNDENYIRDNDGRCYARNTTEGKKLKLELNQIQKQLEEVEEKECQNAGNYWNPTTKKCETYNPKIHRKYKGVARPLNEYTTNEQKKAHYIASGKYYNTELQDWVDEIPHNFFESPLKPGYIYDRRTGKGKYEMREVCKYEQKCWDDDDSKCEAFDESRFVRDYNGQCVGRDTIRGRALITMQENKEYARQKIDCEDAGKYWNSIEHKCVDEDPDNLPTYKEQMMPLDTEQNLPYYSGTLTQDDIVARRSPVRRERSPSPAQMGESVEKIAPPPTVAAGADSHFDRLKKLVVLIAEYNQSDKCMQEIANAFSTYTDGLMLAQKHKYEDEGGFNIIIGDNDMIYAGSPIIGSSSLGFMYEALFHHDYVKDGAGIWEGNLTTGAVFDFSMNVTNAMIYVVKHRGDTVKDDQGLLQKWIDDPNKYFELYVNLKVLYNRNPKIARSRKAGELVQDAVKSTSNPGIASRANLIQLYLNEDVPADAFAAFTIPDGTVLDDMHECVGLGNLYKKCKGVATDTPEQCKEFQAAYDACTKRGRYAKDRAENTAPKLYLIVKMEYWYDVKKHRVVIGDYTFSYIDGIFRFIRWTNIKRLLFNKKALTLSDTVPSYETALHNIINLEFTKPDEPAYYVVTPILGMVDMELYDNLLNETAGKWNTAIVIDEDLETGLNLNIRKQFAITLLYDPETSSQYDISNHNGPLLIYNKTKKLYRSIH